MRWKTFLAVTAVALGPFRAKAAPITPSNPHAYALLIGSNPGGAGQDPLHFAEADAKRMNAVLTEIGGYPPANVKLLLRPNADQIRSTLEELKSRLESDHARGEDSTLFFYYSGHARANAMNLGDDALELADLRGRLTALPSALTIVVLDACQSGAFSRVKGASAAADFSFNSVASLNTRGLAVMASSSSAELSQESDRLRSSYFTHYLLMGLRGAGDQNADGRVSLDEAYRYAYAETLAATAKTRVGGQHVTLETDLTGQGDVAVTYPSAETSQLVLPAAFEGQVLLETGSHHAVVAELTKAAGAPVHLALPPAAYDAIVRRTGSAWTCKIALGDNQAATLDLGACSPVSEEEGVAKGSLSGPDAPVDRSAPGEYSPLKRETWAFEAAIGLDGPTKNDGYAQTLGQFSYDAGGQSPAWSLGASHRILGPVSLIARVREFDSRSYSRPTSGSNPRDFGWSTYGLAIGARGTWDVASWFGVYAQLELGPALGITSLKDDSSTPKVNETEAFFGFYADVATGFQWNPWHNMGFFGEVGYAYAPVIKNLIGDTHDSGGPTFLFGIRGRLWGKP